MNLSGQRYTLEFALCAACCCATLLLDGPRARTELLWADEIISVNAIRRDVTDMARERYFQGHSPLYFIFLKFWMLVSSGADGLSRPTEFTLRLPSLIFMGLAGGLLSATAWRAWGAAAGIILLGLWLGNNLMERFAVEARPYALMIFFVAAGVWGSTRLWLAGETETSPAFGAVATGSRILAAATIPAGAIAVLAMEAVSFGAKGTGRYARFRTRRSCIVLIATIAILAIYAPGIAQKSVNYWVERMWPLSWMNVVMIADVIFVNGRHDIANRPAALLAGIAIPLLALYGLRINRHELPARLAAGLAFAFPATIIFMSAFNSLMVPRYFLAAVPGVLLLAASAASGNAAHSRNRIILALASCAAVMLATDRNLINRPTVYASQLELIRALNPGQIKGSADGWNIIKSIRYYVPLQTGQPVDVAIRREPFTLQDLPDETGIHWFFSSRDPETERNMVARVPVLCRYELPRGNILLLGRSREALPATMQNCPQSDQ